MQVADPKAGIDAILGITLPSGQPSFKPSTQGWCMSLSCLAALVRASRPLPLETQYARLGELAVKVGFMIFSRVRVADVRTDS